MKEYPNSRKMHPEAGDRIKWTVPESRLTLDITINELKSRGNELLITKATVHSISGPKVNKLPEGWVYDDIR